MARLLGKIAARCDTGFAIAVHIRFNRPTLLYQTYARAWIDHYSERGFMLHDPVVIWGLRSAGAIHWDDLHDKDPAGVLSTARDFGLQNGVSLAMGGQQSRTITGLTRSHSRFTQPEIDEFTAWAAEIHRLTDGFDHLPTDEQSALRQLKV